MSVHINAKREDIATVVLLPGDPLRARYIAFKYLQNVKLVNDVRNILAYTGTYQNTLVTIMASGMGISSIGIYAYELFNDYDVDAIIRIGTMGAYDKELLLKDIVVVENAFTDSNFAYNFNGETTNYCGSDDSLLHKIIKTAQINNDNVHVGNILTSEVFYRRNEFYKDYVAKYNVLGVEMESFALFYLAKVLNKKAACILSVSDFAYPNNSLSLTPEEKEKSLDKMILLALNSLI